MIDQNTIALVTGANRGFGKALVAALLSAGVGKIYAAARDPSAVEAQHADSRVVPVTLDVTKADRVAAAAAQAGDVTMLFNNAGVLDFGDILTTPLEKVDRNMAVNFYGKLSMARAFAPVITGNGGGAIINTLSLVALASMPGLAVLHIVSNPKSLNSAARRIRSISQGLLTDRNSATISLTRFS